MTNEQAELLVTDRRFQQLKYFQEKTNVFTIVGQTHTEHWHSSFMKWLFDPNSSLCLGHYPLTRLLALFLIKNENSDFTLQDIYDMDLDQVHFETEKTFMAGGKKRSIDVYGYSGELIIVIENKVKAMENYNGTNVGQTADYYEYVENTREKGQRAFYFFMTPNPKQKSYDENYTKITYQEFYDYIIARCLEHPQLNKDGRYLLEQYANNLREPVHDAPMALVNINLCHELYDEYSEFLDEIFEDVERCQDLSGDKKVTCVLYRHYQPVLDEIYLSLDDKKYGRTPKSLLQRQVVSFDDLYKAGIIRDGAKFEMEYDGVMFHAVAEFDEIDKQCYLLVLDEKEQPYRDQEGNKIGYYRTSSQAGVDAINLYRKKHGITERVATLRGTTYWKYEDGRTVKELIESL